MRLGTLLAAARLEAAVAPARPPGGVPVPGKRGLGAPYSQVPGRGANTPGGDADARDCSHPLALDRRPIDAPIDRRPMIGGPIDQRHSDRLGPSRPGSAVRLRPGQPGRRPRLRR